MSAGATTYPTSALREIAITATPCGLLVCDEPGKILYVNSQLEVTFGYSASELLGAAVNQLLPEALGAGHAADHGLPWSDANAGRADRNLYGRRKDGSRVPVEFGLSEATLDGRRLFIVSLVDISQRGRLEQGLREAAKQKILFERLLAELTVRFVNISPEDVDQTIVDCQRTIVEALGIDRCVLWQFTADDEDLVYTHAWIRPEFPPAPASVSTKELFPWFLSKVRANEIVAIEKLEEIPAELDRENMRRFDTKSTATIPMSIGGHVVGALSFAALRAERPWSPEVLERLKLLAAVFAQGLAHRKSLVDRQAALSEVQQLRDRLASENVQLKYAVQSLKAPRTIATESEAIRRALLQVESVAETDATVLLLGETGCGKEVFAEAIHELSRRRDRPMVRVNCAAIPGALLESELFGRERGAYTGALSRQIGRFELAAGTTIFLDEIAELPLEAQTKLLRVVQEKTLERLGSVKPIHVDVRVIAATNRDLGKAVAEGAFREDLFYRLNVFPITVPPLRERPEDIPVLVWTFIAEFSKAFNKRIESISRESLNALQRHSWPGNVRELRNAIERAVIVARGPRLVVEPPAAKSADRVEGTSLAAVEAGHIRRVLKRVGGRVRGAGGAAELLGMKPTTLDSRMAKLGIRREPR